MAAIGQLLALTPTGPLAGQPSRVSGSDDASLTGSLSLTGDMSIGGNLDVAGDIISRDQVNVVIQDSFLDLGFGNTTDSAQSGGFTVQMNRTSTFTAGSVTSFDSASTFTYADASGSTPLAGGEIIAITGLPTALSANEGFFIVANVDQGAFPQLVTIATTPTASIPFAQTAFTAAAFPAASASGSAFQSDISVLAVADGTSAFKNGAGAAFTKGTFVQAYIPDATVSAFQANGAYNVIGGTTLQQAYNNGNTITTSGNDIGFTLTSGNFSVQGTGAVNIGTSTAVGSMTVAASGNVAINSTSGTLSMGNAASSQAINIGTAGARVITLGQGVGTGPTIVLNGSTGTTILDSVGALSIGSAFTGTEVINFASASGGSLGYVRTVNIGSTASTSTTNIYSATNGGTTIYGLASILSTTSAISLTSSSGAINVDATTNGTIGVGTSGGTGTITVGNTSSVRTITISNGGSGAINIGNDNSSTGLISIAGAAATGSRSINIGTGDTGAKTVTIGDSTVNASVTEIRGGSANGVRINNNVNSPVGIGTGTSTGTITLGGSAAQTIAIGTGAAAKTVTLGSTNTTSTTTIQAGTGNVNGDMLIAADSVTNQFIGIASSPFGVAATGAKTIYIGTDGTAAKTVEIGNSSVAASATRINGGSTNGVSINSSVNSPVTINAGTSTGTVTIGGTATQTIAIGSGATGADSKTVTLGSTLNASVTTLQAGTGALRLASASGVLFASQVGVPSPGGIRAANANVGAGFAEGELAVFETITSSTTGLPNIVKSACATAGAQGLAGVALGSIAINNTGNIASVPGTVTKVLFKSGVGNVPAAGDSGKPVYISDTAGQATMTAPSASGSRVFVVGYLASTGSPGGGLYWVQLMPQFIADIP